MSGSIHVVGIGPGSPAHATLSALDALAQGDVILGYTTYLRLIDGLAPGVPREASGMRQEVARVHRALELARQGKRVVLVSSGDAGVYGMAGLVYEVLSESDESDIEIVVTPGVSALQAAGALLGAPLMADFAAVSLSDQLIPLDEILRRLRLAVEADFVLGLYNPKGRNRSEPFSRACDILLAARPPETPVGVVGDAFRRRQRVQVISLKDLPAAQIDMTTIVVVGNSRTYVYRGRMVTPRGYGSRYDLSARG